MRTALITIALCCLALPPLAAQGSDDPRYQRAFATLLTTAQLGDLVKSWCDARAPRTRDATDTALAAWKSAHQLDAIERRAADVLGDTREALTANVQSRRETIFRALDKDSKSPDADCRQLFAYLNRSANPQRLHPVEFRLVTGQRIATAAPSGSAPATPSEQAPAPRTSGVQTRVSRAPVEQTPTKGTPEEPTRGTRSSATVTRAQITTAPDAGVPMAQIEGIYQPADLRYNPLTLLFEPDETTDLLLTDGWLYENLEVSPHDLNVAESRLFSATRSATAGVVGGGGATSISQSSFTFRPDGTFTWANFSRSFASSSSGTGDGGTRIVVGGTTVGPNGTFSSSVGGGDDEGTYRTDGYTLELRARNGQVLRFPIFSWDTDRYRDFLVINGTTYSPPK